MRVLFVCLGNICRSPLAEALFVHKIASLGLHDRIQADSCGTSNYNIGNGPDPRTLKNALRNGVSMDHTARQISVTDFDEFDHILVMDKQNLRNTLAVADNRHHSKITLMRSFDPMGPGEVPDPYYGGEKDFQEVFEILERSVEGFLQEILRERKY
ncbi:MAG: low molecular weight phosphotyrosine protein phosphatase [Cyclobacteriaceae bacterium]|nr:low molecular weight phosphotyrosine protein phosphatase [Cyclobacteriaceae bacterium]